MVRNLNLFFQGLATIHKNDKQIKGVSEGTLSLSLDFRLLLFIQLQARF